MIRVGLVEPEPTALLKLVTNHLLTITATDQNGCTGSITVSLHRQRLNISPHRCIISPANYVY